jgi:signal transduction histidine kinase
MRINQTQRAFLDAVTHEMRTPLSSFRLYLDTLARHDPDAARRREFLERMGEDLDRLDHTVEQVLAAARADERGRTPLSARVEVAGLLEKCIDEVRTRHGLPERAVIFEPTDRTAVPPVRGDEGELGIVFKNLLENAVKYSEEPLEVRVAVSDGGEGRVRVVIRDRGMGIAPRELRKIFRRFHRASRDVQRKVSGLGLGLFIVRSLVRRQGGRVEAQSEGMGRGSRFVVTLRAAPRSP